MGEVVPFRPRPKPTKMAYETLRCCFCWTLSTAIVDTNVRYHECPGCDEVAAEVEYYTDHFKR